MIKKTTHIGLIAISLLAFSCGGSSSAHRTPGVSLDGGEGGEGAIIDESGGNSGAQETGGNSGIENTGASSGIQETGGTSGQNTGGVSGSTGGSDTGGASGSTGGSESGAGGEIVGGTGGSVGGEGGSIGGAGGISGEGGVGNTGGGCQPWDCINIGIHMYGWDPTSGEPMPEICGLVQDPCTGMMIDCNGCEGTAPIGLNIDPVQPTSCGIRAPTLDEAVNITNESFMENAIEWPNDLDDNPNLCQPSCIYMEDGSLGICNSQTPGAPLLFLCSTENTPPNPNCVPTVHSETAPVETVSLHGYNWCCPQFSNW